MADKRAQAEDLLHDQISQLWNRHVITAAAGENEDRADNVMRLILRALGRTGPVRSSEAAADLGLSRASISRRLSWLEAEGLVRAEADPADGRASLLSLTQAGRVRLEELDSGGADAMRDLVSDFTEDELESFAGFLARFNAKASSRLTQTRKRNHDHP